MFPDVTADKKPKEYNKWGTMFQRNMESSVVMKKWPGRSSMPEWNPAPIPDEQDDEVKPQLLSGASEPSNTTIKTTSRPLQLEELTHLLDEPKADVVQDPKQESTISQEKNKTLQSIQDQVVLAKTTLVKTVEQDERSSEEEEEEDPKPKRPKKNQAIEAQKKRQQARQDEDDTDPSYDSNEEEELFSEEEEEEQTPKRQKKTQLTEAQKKRQQARQEEEEEAAALRKKYGAASSSKSTRKPGRPKK